MFDATARSDILEYVHGADELAVIHDRGAGVSHGEAGAVGTPEEIVGETMHGAIAEGPVNRTVFQSMRRAIGVAVMNGSVHDAADQLVAGAAPSIRSAAVFMKVVRPSASTP